MSDQQTFKTSPVPSFQSDAVARADAPRPTGGSNYVSIFQRVGTYEEMARVARAFASSIFAPREFQGKPENCLVALDLALSLGVKPTAIFQHLYVINGRPAFSAQFMIALVNRAGRFTRIRWEEGTDGYVAFESYGKRICLPNYYATASFTERATGEKYESTRVDVKLALANGWLAKSDSKWRSIPREMCRWRSASWLAKNYCPEALLGLEFADEVADYDAKPIDLTTIERTTEEELENESEAEPEPRIESREERESPPRRRSEYEPYEKQPARRIDERAGDFALEGEKTAREDAFVDARDKALEAAKTEEELVEVMREALKTETSGGAKWIDRRTFRDRRAEEERETSDARDERESHELTLERESEGTDLPGVDVVDENEARRRVRERERDARFLEAMGIGIMKVKTEEGLENIRKSLDAAAERCDLTTEEYARYSRLVAARRVQLVGRREYREFSEQIEKNCHAARYYADCDPNERNRRVEWLRTELEYAQSVPEAKGWITRARKMARKFYVPFEVVDQLETTEFAKRRLNARGGDDEKPQPFYDDYAAAMNEEEEEERLLQA